MKNCTDGNQHRVIPVKVEQGSGRVKSQVEKKSTVLPLALTLPSNLPIPAGFSPNPDSRFFFLYIFNTLGTPRTRLSSGKSSSTMEPHGLQLHSTMASSMASSMLHSGA
ncbi:hypothetical protein LOK49_LG02G02468 [Camellia lanceoleosa]|uniref:Uncharacterized protein n=1 Tax=Camellia lanceoleosa TaxID=1840588 RepID=A0ACC0IGJ1_9ERIC|nr:hypothetical protein LOK49_LG02G02468 [Camellia lanceoleosa]